MANVAHMATTQSPAAYRVPKTAGTEKLVTDARAVLIREGARDLSYAAVIREALRRMAVKGEKR